MMKKDRECLQSMIQRRIDNLPSGYEGLYIEGSRDAYELVLQDINELDEPEVLSQDWIDKNVVHVRGLGDIIEAETVENLLVPKQELPVIPNFVADWIEAERGAMSNWKQPNRFISDSKYKKDQRRYKWSQVEGNMDKFMSALINGYEVEKEPLYYALIKGHELIADEGGSTYKHWKFDTSNDGVFVSKLYSIHDNFLIKMSKSEWNKLGINESNADFVKVEEMEE